MSYINALSLTSNVNEWLANTRHPRILHVFDHACNLVNEHRDVLSVVTPGIGDGPFNLVVEDDVCLSEHLGIESSISIPPAQLHLGDLAVNTADAKLWNPRPDWERFHTRRNEIFDQLTNLSITKNQASGLDTLLTKNFRSYSTTNLQLLASNFSSALVNEDISGAKTITSKLAGLGIGLTPSGDDYLMGAIYAAWIIYPIETATILAREIAKTAAPLTTSLSVAWLRSAGRGEAGILWHEFFDALISDDPIAIQLQIDNLLSIGHTSGVDALAGFIGTFISCSETEANLCHF